MHELFFNTDKSRALASKISIFGLTLSLKIDMFFCLIQQK
ncbi:hypothetical protein HMPREF1987_00106 [Peptostreptococcaceae bacterium oral taxon 113 str. W5053]|nr:hypothetical protein HMPREF1987_00106 [Peptostreptococcaceae bacterium oral taxon 113 str. W5053]